MHLLTYLLFYFPDPLAAIMGRGGREGKGKGWEYEGEERGRREGREGVGTDVKGEGWMGRKMEGWEGEG